MFWFVLALLALAAGLVLFLLFRGKKKNLSVGVLLLSVAVSAALLLASCIVAVPTGHTGVVTTFGRVEDYTLPSGIHLKAPWQNVVKMDNRVQKRTATLSCFSSDIQEVSLLYTINYQIKKSDAMTIYSTIGPDYYDTVITPCITESVKVVTARYTAEQLVGFRNELAAAIEKDLYEKLLTFNIEVVSTSIENMDFTDAFTDAVEAKQVAQQNKLRAETEAEQRIIEANAAAEVLRVNADAEAYQVRARAEAEAEANRMIAESLTEQLIAYTYASRWNGELPKVVTGEGTLPILDLEGLTNVPQTE